MVKVEKNDLLELEIFKHVEESPLLTNRKMAKKLGVSIKLSHAILRSMVERGMFHIKKYHSRRWDYFLTPKGIAEKARLTREFIVFSMQFYQEARNASAQICRNIAEAGMKNIAFIGAGDLAEIAFLGVKEWDLNLASVYSDDKAEFLGWQCQKLTSLSEFDGDAFIVCLYETKYLPNNIKPDDRMYWIF